MYPSQPVGRKDSGRICLCSKVPVVALAYGETMTRTFTGRRISLHVSSSSTVALPVSELSTFFCHYFIRRHGRARARSPPHWRPPPLPRPLRPLISPFSPTTDFPPLRAPRSLWFFSRAPLLAAPHSAPPAISTREHTNTAPRNGIRRSVGCA